MEQYRPELARRVWERVQHREERADLYPSLMALAGEAAGDAAACRQLLSVISGRKVAALRLVAANKQELAACLRGISRILGSKASQGAVIVPKGPAEAMLRRCLGHTLRAMDVCRHWRGHPEYGPVFDVLADRETENARLLLLILGEGFEGRRMRNG